MPTNDEVLWKRWKVLWKRSEQGTETDCNAPKSCSARIVAAVDLETPSAADTIRGSATVDTIAFDGDCEQLWERWRSRARALHMGDKQSLNQLAEDVVAWLTHMAPFFAEAGDPGRHTSNYETIRGFVERRFFLKPTEAVILAQFFQGTQPNLRASREILSIVLLQHCQLIQSERVAQMLSSLDCTRAELVAVRDCVAELVDSQQAQNGALVSAMGNFDV